MGRVTRRRIDDRAEALFGTEFNLSASNGAAWVRMLANISPAMDMRTSASAAMYLCTSHLTEVLANMSEDHFKYVFENAGEK